jgi:hypothetical protein
VCPGTRCSHPGQTETGLPGASGRPDHPKGYLESYSQGLRLGFPRARLGFSRAVGLGPPTGHTTSILELSSFLSRICHFAKQTDTLLHW